MDLSQPGGLPSPPDHTHGQPTERPVVAVRSAGRGRSACRASVPRRGLGSRRACWRTLPDDRAREARRELLDELHEDGVTAGGAPAGRQGAAAGARAGRAAARRRAALQRPARSPSGSASSSTRCRRPGGRSGCRCPIRARPALGEEDLEAAGDPARRCRAAGFDDEDLLETNRVLGRGIARYAEALRSTIAESLLRARVGRARARAAVHERWPRSSCHSPRRGWSTSSRCTSARCCATRRSRCRSGPPAAASESHDQTIAFADLVGFTELGETVAVEELSDVAGNLSRLAGELVDPPVRLVKMIGDAVMLVSPEAEPTGRHDAPAGRARGGRRRASRPAGRRRVRPGRQPLRRLVRLDRQPRQPADRPRPAGLRARHRGGARRARRRRLRVVLGRPEAPEGHRRAGQDVPRQARAGRVSAFTKSSSWRVVQHS